MVLSMMKTVRFSLEESVHEYEYPSPSRSSCATETMWYQPSDYDQMRLEALVSVQEAKQKGMNAFIKQNYGCTDSKTQEMLNVWAKCKDTNRGLERFVSEEYGQQRQLHRRKIIEAVLFAQNKLRKENRNDVSAASIIQTVSSTLSGNAIQFARMLAIADRAAVDAREMKVRIVPFPPLNRVARPPTGRSPVASRKHSRDTSSASQRPPRHPGPVRFQIRVSALA